MKEFFADMTSLQQTFWIIALIGSAIFVIIFALTFIGGGDADMEADMEDVGADDTGVGFQFFTLKNLVAFFTIFGWTGIICVENEMTNTVSIIIASISGLIMMVLTSLLFFYMSKLAHSGTLNIRNAIGVDCEVYLPIGAKRSSMGKVQIRVQGSLRELKAMKDEEEDLKTSSIVKVVDVVSSEILLVKKV